jgi:hypothetical protein
LTVAVALTSPGALAVMVAAPGAMPVTCTTALVAPAAKVTADGTVATPFALEARVMVRPPAGAAPPARTRVRFPVLLAVIESGDPWKARRGGFTVTVPEPGVKPGAVAVMVADPIAAPFTWTLAVVAPAAITTLGGTVTADALLLARLTVTPLVGAGCPSVICNVADWPSPTDAFATVITPDTFTVAVAFARPGALAVIVAAPGATPVTDTAALVAPEASVTADGTVATLFALEARVMVRPLAGAAPPARFSVRFPVLPAVTASGDPAKAMVGAVTVTVALPEVKPVADAEMVADPIAAPVTWMVPVVDPDAITMPVETMTIAGLLLLRLTVTPFAGAGCESVT